MTDGPLCSFCGAPVDHPEQPHRCPAEKEHRRVSRLTAPHWMRSGKRVDRAPMLDEDDDNG